MRQRATRVPAPKPQPVQPATAQPETIPTAESRPAPGLPAEFDENQELLAEALRHLLLYGGHEDDVKAMVTAAMQAYFEREVDPLSKSESAEERRELVCKRAAWSIDDRCAALKRAWLPTPSATKLERPKSGATALHLFQVRERLVDRFDEFLRNARPVELHLMEETLEFWWGNAFPGDTSSPDIALAEAMARQLYSDEKFVVVPNGCQKLVEQYIGFLKEGKKGCAA